MLVSIARSGQLCGQCWMDKPFDAEGGIPLHCAGNHQYDVNYGKSEPVKKLKRKTSKLISRFY